MGVHLQEIGMEEYWEAPPRAPCEEMKKRKRLPNCPSGRILNWKQELSPVWEA